jgi:hypothetical protein
MAQTLRPGILVGATLQMSLAVRADPLPPQSSSRPLPTQRLSAVKAQDEAEKPAVEKRQHLA